MAADYGLFGSGPGTFEPLYNLFYRISPTAAVEPQVHDDWLETLITFGSLGLGLIVAVLTLVAYRLSQALRNPATRWIAAFIGLSLAICLAHAKGDFPLQVDSILRLFVLLCCLSWCLPAFHRHAGDPHSA
jgi:O-antigen ligase